MEPYHEINIYLAKAKGILSTKAQKDGNEYRDIKYVQMAAGTAYNAALMIVDEYLKKRKGPGLSSRRASKNTAIGCGNTIRPCCLT